MVNKKKVSIDLSCKQTQENDTLMKDGERTTYSGVYKGETNVGSNVVTVELKLKSDNREALEDIVPLSIGSKRNMELGLTNEDLDNHDL